jgi:hypothetical protein
MNSIKFIGKARTSESLSINNDDPLERPRSALLLAPAEKHDFRGNTKAPDFKSLNDMMRSTSITDDQYAFKKNQYKFIRTLGSGTYAVVKEAEWLPTGQHVAVKIMTKTRMTTVGKTESLQNELEILSKVDHPNLLRFLDWGMGTKSIYIVTEL